ncbi:MAG: hypothetical protein E7261_00700 [Lachnospiraceae bacterium]|nr:hypothetical protein [Lachnospiraceae bacterium]
MYDIFLISSFLQDAIQQTNKPIIHIDNVLIECFISLSPSNYSPLSRNPQNNRHYHYNSHTSNSRRTVLQKHIPRKCRKRIHRKLQFPVKHCKKHRNNKHCKRHHHRIYVALY